MSPKAMGVPSNHGSGCTAQFNGIQPKGSSHVWLGLIQVVGGVLRRVAGV